MMESNVDLGFIDKVEPWKIKSKFYPSKIGGHPAWLALNNLPTQEQISCNKCHKSMAFLCQLYAPHTSEEYGFHRMVFVFICRDAKCSQENDASNIKVLRCQLPRLNEFYDFRPYKIEEIGSDSPSAADFYQLCFVCGSPGSKVCGGCKSVRYCGRDHQAWDWKDGHKAQCKNKDAAKINNNSFVLPEFNLELEPEFFDEPKPEKTEEQVMKEYEELLASGRVVDSSNADDDNTGDLVKMAAKETDKQFQRFRTKVKDEPNQVIRYERNGEPLWVSSENKPQNIPPCPHCGKQRQFEFQIMPQLLVHLKVDSKGQSIDWGTILVYTCPNSCLHEDSNNMYIDEVVYKQDYSPVDVIMRNQ